MSNLQQMQLTYDQLQDRLVLILYTQDWCEYRFWITRRAVRMLWKMLTELLARDQKDQQQHQQESQQIGKKIEQETSQRQPLAEQYSSRLTRKPLGEEPLLIYKVMASPGKQGGSFLRLEDIQGRSIEFGGDSKIITALCQLIRRITKQAEWDLHLEDKNV